MMPSEQLERAYVRAVVVNYNRAELTLRCLESLKAQNYSRLELVVVDNHSDEQDWSLLQRDADSSVVLHRTDRNLGYAGGINAGARLQTGEAPELVFVLNSDITLADPNAVQLLVASLQEKAMRVASSPLIRDRDRTAPPRQCVQVRRMPGFWTLLFAHSCWLRRTAWGRRVQNRHLYFDLIPFPLGETIECETINGACFMVSRNFLETIGYLDERTFLYMEEFTLGASIRLHDSTACLCTSVVADHFQGASTGMRAHHRPFHRELQQIQSEAVYLTQYVHAGVSKMGLFWLVRVTDVCLKTLSAPFRSRA
jgi:GT2 family glycosyltransferase